MELHVRDTGIGTPHDALPRRFEQADPPLDGGHTGLGGGLALSSRVAELHGGTVELRSLGGNGGSEFIGRLSRRSVLHGGTPRWE